MYQDYDIRPFWIGYDPWNSKYWVDEMKEQGFQMEQVRQGAITLSQPMKEMGADLAAKLINYNNNPVLKWCLTNTNVKRDENDNIRPIKGKNQRQRIDGAVSLLIAYTVLFNKMSDYRALL
jgi:phage terminase large subunit-like protein